MASHRPQASDETSFHGTTAAESRPLRALSLDGGGVRGLSSLLILRRIMHNVKPSDSLYDIAKPCEYFDMICGTSTGGLIAIMLGRLQMGVQEAIDAYLVLAEKVFRESHPFSRVMGARTLGALLGNARYSGDALTDAIQEIVEGKTDSKDTLLLDTREDACRVFVCATRTANTEPALLRSYRSNREEGCHAAIWEAGRATSAAPTFFPPIKFGKPPAEYVDGAIGHNNPIRLLMREVESVWGSSAKLACVLSIGTGVSEPKKLGSKGHKVLLACKKLATSAEAIARSFYMDQGEKLQREGKYFRFNVSHGLQGISLEEWQTFDQIDAATRMYLEDVNEAIQACCDRLKDRSASLNSPRSPVASPFSNRISSNTTSLGTFDVPHNSSPYFTGRSESMQAIEKHFLHRHPHNPQIVVLSGLGGIGKTQIALHYFERHKSSYSSAFFVQCNSEQEAIAAYVRFAGFVVDEELRATPTSNSDEVAKRLGFSGLLTERPGQLMNEAHRRVVNAVCSWLGRQQGKFLVILDNADDPNAMNLTNFIPHHRNGDIIITSRDAGAMAFGQLFKIEEMSEDEAVTLLGQASHLKLDTQELRDAAKKITEALGYLPLAIDQACGYLVTSGSDIRNFLSTYKLHYKSLLSRIPNDGMLGYKKSALTTWEMSFGRLQSESPQSASLLQHLGFMHCKDICEPLFYPADEMTNMSWGLQGDSFSFDETFALVCKLSLMRRNEKPRTYEIHKVVHLWIKERLDLEQRALYARGAIVSVSKTLAALNQKNSRWVRETHRRLLPHVEAAWNNVEEYTSLKDDGIHTGFMNALQVVSNSFRTQGYYELAERGFIRVYKANIINFGTDANETLHAAADLAAIYKLGGNMPKAEEFYRFVLKGFTRVLGSDDIATLQALHDLASVLRYRGGSDEAITLYQQALDGRRKKCGHEGLETLETMDSLAGLYQDLKRSVDAEPLRLFALQARQKILGPEHADTLRTALNMGLLYSNMGKHEQALELFDRAYMSRVTLLKSQSPNACNALSLIAALYANIGHVNKSEMLYREVLSSQQDVLGAQHPDTLWTLNHLSVILFSKERSEAAIQSVEKSATDLESVLGVHNLDTLWVFHNLAMIYAFLGRFKEAEELQELVVDGYLTGLGPDHINTLYMLNDLGDCYLRAGKYDKAEEMIRRAFEGKRKHFGPRSQYTLYSATLLACTIKELGRRKEAERMYTQTFETTLETLGFDHSAVWWVANYLAEFYVEAQRWREAEKLYERLLEVKTKFLGETHASTSHSRELLEATRKQMMSPENAPRSAVLSRPAKSLPSDFGYRARNDIVQVLF
ncbi:tetratricopeptide repeat domain-containing protein [Pochonia chlamydosporia 170]|uniref:Tetratricopeptide repeat domain-containing protein n=1 Tax=Pochonia chlamydosporia 170 TaxID=1380566 RepID=A0A179F456_METCM|nr:tetratricopeptide repeat domain-containing protein [Pochonia chlamydosporia 170]OAQ60207.1 tetratricopeptide repeat domain-containing protein [Pochonia chlamydosporia 170]